jgi:hypothetical protein
LVDVLEEDPLVEPAALGPLAIRFELDVLPADGVHPGQGPEYFQHVGQLRGQLLVRRRLRLVRFFHQLGSQRVPVAGQVEDAGTGLAPGGRDNVRDPVTDELVVVEAHVRDSTQGWWRCLR